MAPVICFVFLVESILPFKSLSDAKLFHHTFLTEAEAGSKLLKKLTPALTLFLKSYFEG